MKKSIFGLAFGVLALSGIQITAQAAVNLEEGKVAFDTCRGCHSSPGYSNAYPTFYVPKVGGQRAAYIASALQAYREQKRPHGTMKANANGLTDKTIENIAAYLEASKAKPSASPADGDAVKGKELAQTCLGCHAEGPDAGPAIPRLAGQYGNYLVKAMKEYQSGKRNNALMQSMVKDLSDKDLTDLSAYFASLKGLVTAE
jgi:cytochrome c553